MTAIANTSHDMLFGPTVDGVEIPDIPENLAARGEINKLDAALFGTVHDEGRFMMPLTESVPGGPFTNESEFRRWLEATLPPKNIEEVSSLYQAKDYGGNWWYTAAALYTDQQYTCPAARSARWLTRSGRVPANNTFVYEVTYAPDSYRNVAKWAYFQEYCLPGFTPHGGHLNHFFFPCPEVNVDMGVGHAAELAFLFPGLKTIGSNEKDTSMAEDMLGWWQSFAATNNPTVRSGSSSAMSLHWEPFAVANQTFYLNPEKPAAVASNRARFCEFWDRQHPIPHIAEGLMHTKPVELVV